jgi:formylglycine-generating enzyme required for sulfatase activity
MGKLMKSLLVLLAAIFALGCSSTVSILDGSTEDQKSLPDSDLADLTLPDKAGPKQYVCRDNGRCRQPFCDQAVIPAGEFWMGDDIEPDGIMSINMIMVGDPRPRHRVYLDAYCIDQYQVSISRYRACANAGRCAEGPSEPCGYHPPGAAENPDFFPVIRTSHYDAADYCQWIGRRLCTEAEWERAASGPAPGKRTYPWGEEPPVQNKHGNFRTGGSNHYTPVYAYPQGRSYEGAFDLAGNGYEWVSDGYAVYDPPTDGTPHYNPTGPKPGVIVVARGGCPFWQSTYTSFERSVVQRSFTGA